MARIVSAGLLLHKLKTGGDFTIADLNDKLAKQIPRVYTPARMNDSDKPSRSGTPISSEARVGTGITVAGLGFLCLMLAWAQHLRSVPNSALVLLVLGVPLMVLGGIAALSGSGSRRR